MPLRAPCARLSACPIPGVRRPTPSGLRAAAFHPPYAFPYALERLLGLMKIQQSAETR